MPAMRRRGHSMLTGAVVLSLVLWLAAACTWAVSGVLVYRTSFRFRGQECELVLRRGELEWTNEPTVHQRSVDLLRAQWEVNALGGGLRDAMMTRSSEANLNDLRQRVATRAAAERALRAAMVAPWSHALSLAVACGVSGAATLGLFVWLRWLEARRTAAGRYCPACDYDLTGNLSGVCPECGRPVSRPDAVRA